MNQHINKQTLIEHMNQKGERLLALPISNKETLDLYNVNEAVNNWRSRQVRAIIQGEYNHVA